MSLSTQLFDIFQELNYPNVKQINFDSISLIDLSKILNWITIQLQFFSKTDSIINVIKDEKSDLDALKIELSSLLNELGSIYSDDCQIETDNSKRQYLLYSLAGDLLASRINYIRKFDENLDVFTNKLNPKNDIKIINNCLSISSDLKNVKNYFHNVKDKLNKSLLRFHEEDSLLLPNKNQLNSQQWMELKKLNENLQDEFSIRREMMLRRADMTVNSFSWNAEDNKTREIDEQTIRNIYNDYRKKWSIQPNVTLSHALAARSSDCDSLINKRISINHAACFIETPQIGKANIGLQQRLQLHKFLIGSVPDRGGRPYEQPPPPKETFEQQKNQRDNRGGRGGGGSNRGGSRGGGGHDQDRNQQYQSHQQQNYNQQHHQQPQQYYQKQQNYHHQGGRNSGGGGRIQGAGWQQQDYYQQDDYQQQQQQQNYYQNQYYDQQHRGGSGGGGGGNYHRQRGRGGYRGGGGGRNRDYY